MIDYPTGSHCGNCRHFDSEGRELPHCRLELQMPTFPGMGHECPSWEARGPNLDAAMARFQEALISLREKEAQLLIERVTSVVDDVLTDYEELEAVYDVLTKKLAEDITEHFTRGFQED